MGKGSQVRIREKAGFHHQGIKSGCWLGSSALGLEDTSSSGFRIDVLEEQVEVPSLTP